MPTTPESLEQTCRVRSALELAALLGPTYWLDPEVPAPCWAAETRLLPGAIETDSADTIHERGVRSGNLFFLETARSTAFAGCFHSARGDLCNVSSGSRLCENADGSCPEQLYVF